VGGEIGSQHDTTTPPYRRVPLNRTPSGPRCNQRKARSISGSDLKKKGWNHIRWNSGATLLKAKCQPVSRKPFFLSIALSSFRIMRKVKSAQWDMGLTKHTSRR